MPVRKTSYANVARLRRAHPAYVMTITAVAVWFWWLLAVSQTTLSGVWSPTPPNSAGLQEPKTAAALAAYHDFKEIEQKQLDADRDVASAREAVAITQRQWEEWLSGQAERENDRSLNAAPTRNVENPDYLAAAAALEQLKLEQKALLQRLTPEHPEAVYIAARVSEFEQRLARIPHYLTAAGQPTDAEISPATATKPESDRLAIRDRESLSLGSDAGLPAAADAGAANLRAAWDTAQTTLNERIRVAQQYADRLEALRRQGADQPLARAEAAMPMESMQSFNAQSSWSLGAALAILAVLEGLALRMAWTIAAAPTASTPLASVEAVAAILPLPIFAAMPASGHARPLAAKLTDDGLSPAMLWVLACEGSMAAMVFLLAAMTSQNVGFPADLLAHPIEAVAHGLSGLHS